MGRTPDEHQPVTDRGCMGMPSVLNVASPSCQSCKGFAPCRTAALSVLETVRGTVKVDDMIHELRAGQEGAKPAVEIEFAIASVPKKVAPRLRSLLAKGFDRAARDALRDGVNPFPLSGAKHMHLAGELLLLGRFTKGQYRQDCMNKFGWAEGTAFSEVSMAIALMRGLGLVSVDGDAVTANQTTRPF